MESRSSLKLHPIARPDARAEAGRLLEDAYQQVLCAFGLLGHPVTTDENYAGTAARAAKAMLEMVHPVSEAEDEITAMLEKTFPARYDGMVISKHNTCFSLCPHHLLPVVY